jgi:hypothetical protein
MNFIKKTLLNVYLFILLIFTMYQDFIGLNYIGEIGRTPIFWLIPIFVLIEFLSYVKMGSLQISKFQKYFLFFIIYITFISMFYTLANFFFNGYVFLGENLLNKSVKGIMYLILILLYIRHIHLIFSKYNNIKELYQPFIFSVIFIFLLMIIEYYSLPNALKAFHAGVFPYYRIRLLTFESSMTGTIIIVYCGITFFLATLQPSKLFRYLSYSFIITFLLIYTFITGSRGFLITILIVLIFIMIRSINFNKIKRGQIIFLFLVPILLVFFGINFLDKIILSMNNDINNYTSLSTRLSTIVAATLIIIKNPLGIGTGAYIIEIPKYIESAFNITEKLLRSIYPYTQLNKSELLTYLSSDKNLGVKSGVFQWLMIGGIGTAIFFYKSCRYFYSIIKYQNILLITFVFVTFSVVFYINFEIKYEIWLLFVFIESLKGALNLKRTGDGNG